MKYVYPNNLMARRSEKKEILKGGILFAVIVLIITGLFFASEYSQSYNYFPAEIHCIQSGAQVKCSLE